MALVANHYDCILDFLAGVIKKKGPNMIKWLTCLLWGKSCVWHTTHIEKYRRGAYGIYMGVQPPRVECERHVQQCKKCGQVREREVVLNPEI